MQVRDLEGLWGKIRGAAAKSENPPSRLYRALGETTVGVRACHVPSEQRDELLVEVPHGWGEGRVLPEWRGIRLEVIPLTIAPRDTHQLALSPAAIDDWAIFLHIAADIATCLEGLDSPSERASLLLGCLERWSHFFERCGGDGLSAEAQRGMLAELLWLEHLLGGGVAADIAVDSWHGCERAYHDFDLDGSVVEVKSTMTKEPRRVWINNERQLDDRALHSLHLYVATLHPTAAGVSLPAVVAKLRRALSGRSAAGARFEEKLVSGGCIDAHTSH